MIFFYNFKSGGPFSAVSGVNTIFQLALIRAGVKRNISVLIALFLRQNVS